MYNNHDNCCQQRPDPAGQGKLRTKKKVLPVNACSKHCCLLKGLCQKSPLPTPLVLTSRPDPPTHPLLGHFLGYPAVPTKTASPLHFWRLYWSGLEPSWRQAKTKWPRFKRVVQYTRTVTVCISHVSIRTYRTDRQQGYTVCKVCFTVSKSHLQWDLEYFMARTVIYGLSIRTDRTDRQKGYTVCKECFTVRKSHLISGTQNISWQELLYTVCRSVRIERIDNRGIRSVKNVLRSVNRI